MPQFCTCGAQPPDDARFCHRCGKSLREEPEIVLDRPLAERSAVQDAPAPASSRISFSNPLALRTSLMVATITTLLEMIPFVNFVAPIFAGYASVSLYKRSSGQSLSPGSGAKLGWITAVINALLLTILATINIAVAGPAIFELLREQLRRPGTQPQALQMLDHPALFTLSMWVVLFAISSALHMAGGVMGARFSRSRRA